MYFYRVVVLLYTYNKFNLPKTVNSFNYLTVHILLLDPKRFNYC